MHELFSFWDSLILPTIILYIIIIWELVISNLRQWLKNKRRESFNWKNKLTKFFNTSNVLETFKISFFNSLTTIISILIRKTLIILKKLFIITTATPTYCVHIMWISTYTIIYLLPFVLFSFCSKDRTSILNYIRSSCSRLLW